MATEKKSPERPQDFTEVFKARIDKIQTDAAAVGLDFTKICRETGVSRSTPDRWRRKIPKTITLVTEMERRVAEETAQQQ